MGVHFCLQRNASARSPTRPNLLWRCVQLVQAQWEAGAACVKKLPTSCLFRMEHRGGGIKTVDVELPPGSAGEKPNWSFLIPEEGDVRFPSFL